MNPGTGSAPHAPNAKSIRLWNTLSRLARGEPSSGGGAGAVRRGVSRRRGVATHYLRVNQSYERRAVAGSRHRSATARSNGPELVRV